MCNKSNLLNILILSLTLSTIRSQSWVESTHPQLNEIDIDNNSQINISFTEHMDESTLNDSTILIHGTQRGLYSTNSMTYNDNDLTVTILTENSFSVGEIISVIVTSRLKDQFGTSMSEPFIFSFTISPDEGTGGFTVVEDIIDDFHHVSYNLGDVDSDGDLDIVYLNTPETLGDYVLKVLINDGSGNFTEFGSYYLQNLCLKPVLSDFDLDGDLDIVIICQEFENLYMLINEGDGNFNFAGTPLDLSDYGWFTDLETVDFDLDGDLDILGVVEYDTSRILLFNNVISNNNDSLFIVSNVITSNSIIKKFTNQIFGDIDSDGDCDFILKGYMRIWDDGIDWWVEHPFFTSFFNDGNDNFSEGYVYYTNRYRYGRLIDFNGDGDLDFIILDQDHFFTPLQDQLIMYENDGFGYFAYHSSISSSSFLSFTEGDFDNDGDIDFITGENTSQGAVYTLKNDGYGYYNYLSGSLSGFQGNEIISGDLNGDGSIDIFISQSNNGWPGEWGTAILFNGAPPSLKIESNYEILPANYKLKELFPNPFNSTTSIQFDIPNKSQLKITVFDIVGREIAVLLNDELETGSHTLLWNANNITSGVYFVSMTSGDYHQTQKVVLLK